MLILRDQLPGEISIINKCKILEMKYLFLQLCWKKHA